MIDPYALLGVSKAATQDEIKNAYRGLAKKLHPDLNPGNKTAEAKFKEIAAAYELIGTPEMRAKFDRGETEAQQQQQREREYASQSQGRGPFYSHTQSGGGRYSSSFGEGTNEDIFESIFGSARRSGQGFRGQENFAGEDQLYKMNVDFRDAVLGSEREITLPSGKKLKVKIPAGIETGSRLRFKNQGGPGVGGGPAGDAYVEITVNPHSGFSRVGKDIETEVPISFMEGLLGAEIQVPTLENPVLLKIPSGVSTGSRLRIRGKGVAKTGEERGDQIVVLKVALPKKVDPELERIIRDWDGKFSYNPRGET